MNWVDAVVVAIILVSGLIGWVRGLVREALGIGAWLLAAWIAFTWYDRAEPLVLRYLTNPDIAHPVAFGAVFLVSLIVLSVIAAFVGRLVQGSPLSTVDGTLGLAFGLVRGAVLVAAAYIAGALLLPMDRWPPPVQQARSLPYIHDAAVWMVALVPQQFQPYLPQAPGIETKATQLLQAAPAGSALATRPPVPQDR
jgi:membrane protein required for colicin V production